MTRASGRNEAKIHLGFVYANDDSFRTASLMLDAGLAFAPLLDSWLERPLDWRSMRSRPFVYAVMRESLLSLDQLCAFYARVQDGCLERLRGGNYLGERPALPWRPIPPRASPAWIASSQIAGLIETAEVALDLGQFRLQMASSLAASGIETMFGMRVESVARTPSGFRAEGSTTAGESWRQEADILVNCLWEDRLRLDETMGLRPSRPWVYRLKYRLLGQLPSPLANLPSLTFVLGPYGDIATYPASPTYMNWYPACLQGWSDDLAPPAAWNEPCEGRATSAAAAELTREALSALDRIVPGSPTPNRSSGRRGHLLLGQIARGCRRPRQRAPPTPRDRRPCPRRLFLHRHRQIHLRAALRQAPARRPGMTSARSAAPLLTVAIPLYKSRRFLEIISENIRNADYPNLEILVGDRHLADDTLEQLRARFPDDSRLRFLTAKDRLPWVEHYNALLAAASGQYFLWMPHDDSFPPGYIGALVDRLEAAPPIPGLHLVIAMRNTPMAGAPPTGMVHQLCRARSGRPGVPCACSSAGTWVWPCADSSAVPLCLMPDCGFHKPGDGHTPTPAGCSEWPCWDASNSSPRLAASSASIQPAPTRSGGPFPPPS